MAPIQAKYQDRSPLAQHAVRSFLRTIHSLVAVAAPRTLLDGGCGEGVVLRSLPAQTAIPLVGLDLDAARLKLAESGPDSLTLVRGNVEELPFEDSAFEMVMLLEVLEHVGRPEKAIREAYRVSSRFLLASVPNEPWWHIGNLLRLKYVRHLGNTPEHINHWTFFGFRRFVGRHFAVRKVATPILWTVVLAEKAPPRGAAGYRD